LKIKLVSKRYNFILSIMNSVDRLNCLSNKIQKIHLNFEGSFFIIDPHYEPYETSLNLF
jgi:hypothetical protein